jgi:hypothetical protein
VPSALKVAPVGGRVRLERKLGKPENSGNGQGEKTMNYSRRINLSQQLDFLTLGAGQDVMCTLSEFLFKTFLERGEVWRRWVK